MGGLQAGAMRWHCPPTDSTRHQVGFCQRHLELGSRFNIGFEHKSSGLQHQAAAPHVTPHAAQMSLACLVEAGRASLIQTGTLSCCAAPYSLCL